jgi:acyl transferase domain-containing protein
MAHVRGVSADPGDDVRIGVHLGNGEAVLTGPGVDRWLRDHEGQRLATDGAWHGPWLAGARDRWARDLAAIAPRPLTTTLISADTGEPAVDVVAHLLSQLVSPLRWSLVVGNLVAAGVRDWVVVGPGRPVRYALRTSVPDARIHRTDDAASFAATARALATRP